MEYVCVGVCVCMFVGQEEDNEKNAILRYDI